MADSCSFSGTEYDLPRTVLSTDPEHQQVWPSPPPQKNQVKIKGPGGIVFGRVRNVCTNLKCSLFDCFSNEAAKWGNSPYMARDDDQAKISFNIY